MSRNERSVPDDAWRLRKAKTLIKLLALAPERRMHVDQATELLWPDRDPGSARNNLHQTIYAARRALDAVGLEGRRYLELGDDLIALSPADPAWIDAAEFEAAAERARQARDPAIYRAALDAYAGDLLPEDRYEGWTSSRRDALHDLRLALGIELAELEAHSDPAAAIGHLRDVLVDEPLHEPAHRALMRLYAETGRRQEALEQFQELKRGLRREFEDEPDDETRRLYQELLARRRDGAGTAPEHPEQPDRPEHSEPPSPRAQRSGSLPAQLSSFVGRGRELGEVAALLNGSRLLTLTGAGGCGKTRLAFELAEQHLEDFADGVWPVEFAALSEPELIGPAIAQALDARLASERAPEIALAGHIGDREQLLLLDNCEHLVEPIAHLVEALLRLCPKLSVLATSREPLRVPGEVTWRVPSLSLPRLGDDQAPYDVLRAESVRLFCDRAAQAAPGFQLDDANAKVVATLCHRLDGMPLAIELAAARAGVLAPAQIVERLDGALDLLSAGSRTAMTRQQTLRATLEWSFDLLDPEEQVLLRRLSVFAGSFGLEAAEDICADDPLERSEAAALLGRLVDKSLVNVEEESGEHRYRLLETVRQYAGEHLEEAGERAGFEHRHRDWYVELAESDPTPPGELPAQDRLRRLERERDNLRAALTSALAHEPEIGLRLGVGLWRFWLMRGYLAEGYRWLAALLTAAPERTAVRARALLAACLLGLRRGIQRVDGFGAESVEIFRELDEHGEMFDALEILAAYRAIAGGPDEIEELLSAHERLTVEGLPAARPRAWAAHTRGIAAWFSWDHGETRRQLESALAYVGELAGDPRPALWPLSYGMFSIEAEIGYPLFLHEDTVLLARRVGAEEAAAYILVNLATVDRIEGDLSKAAELMEDSLGRFQRLDDRQGEAFALNALGNLARSSGDFERGQVLLEHSLAMRTEIGDRRGSGITLGCLGVLLARSGDLSGARASAEKSRSWFAENDDLIGLGAAELCLTSVALCAGERACARSHLEAATSIFGGIESTPQEGWAQAVLATIYAEDDEPATARHWLDRATRHFESLGGEAGLAYCRKLEGLPGMAASAVAE